MQSVFTGHDTYIGVLGNPADLYVNGALSVVGGADGVLKLPDGTDTLKSGEAINIEKIGCYYEINWTRGNELDTAIGDIVRIDNSVVSIQASLNEQCKFYVCGTYLSPESHHVMKIWFNPKPPVYTSVAIAETTYSE